MLTSNSLKRVQPAQRNVPGAKGFERIRILLSLGCELRQWEERLG